MMKASQTLPTRPGCKLHFLALGSCIDVDRPVAMLRHLHGNFGEVPRSGTQRELHRRVEVTRRQMACIPVDLCPGYRAI